MTTNNNKIFKTMDGNEAASRIAYLLSEICIIYPITPASAMGEFSDQWATERVPNIWNSVPEVVTMQSEGGASGALHGAVQTGALATTFTSSQGLLLMIPNMYRIAGELTPTVFHVATRAVAPQGMSIYCDHSDIYAVRQTGFAMLGSASVQEAQDMALIATRVSLESSVPFVHFFDGFRTSHEVAKIELLSNAKLSEFIDPELIFAHRARRLTPNDPSMRSAIANTDTFFQTREAVNKFYNDIPKIIDKAFLDFANLTGRKYDTVEYYGDKNADRVIVIMGSAAETVKETIDYLNNVLDQKVGVLKIRLYRPFPTERFFELLPKTCTSIAVLDRSKEPGAVGEPLFEDVAAALADRLLKHPPLKNLPRIVAGRYGLASKEFTPAMIKAIFDELTKSAPKNHFTIGIEDDITFTSLDYDKNLDIESNKVIRAIFYGLGADGTVSANKNTIKIIGEETDQYVQGYFVYDSKKSGSRTASHLRFSPEPIRAEYLISAASFIGCHQFNFVEKINVLEKAAVGATFLLNSPHPVDVVWNKLPAELQQIIIDKKINFYVINGYKVAKEAELGAHINTVMQTCFFALSNVLPRDMAIAKIKSAIKKSYAGKGEAVVQKNFAAVDKTLANLFQVKVPDKVTSNYTLLPHLSANAPEFAREVLGKMLAGYGDDLPVSAFPPDGYYKTNTTCFEKRNVSMLTPVWQPENCIQCGQCNIVCPHSVIRAKTFDSALLKNAPADFKAHTFKAAGSKENDQAYALHIYAEDCVGCGLCVEYCPVNRGKSGAKALVMQPKPEDLTAHRDAVEFFESLPNKTGEHLDATTVHAMQFVDPMFEFCSACPGCGEAPYVKLLTKIVGDRLTIADACGCSLAYGASLPTAPWTKNAEGRGPAFGASLFEDNAEFGYGYLLSYEKHRAQALELLDALSAHIDAADLINAIKNSSQTSKKEIALQRERIKALKEILSPLFP
ncbi:MAG: pyruvate:ferredoxin (flavodoxin) oxidoreductase, partial [Gammaproteobacteria bacterium]|nr:pyruvate:ferredoxin (flavodoxin) oxidoreductase [Gammaproteobacteria bacterium]